MSNQVIFIDDFNDEYVRQVQPIGTAMSMIEIFQGKPVIYGNGGVMLFDTCEYCGGHSIDEQNFCRGCGAPAWRDRDRPYYR